MKQLALISTKGKFHPILYNSATPMRLILGEE
jgi:hypothetical protein